MRHDAIRRHRRHSATDATRGTSAAAKRTALCLLPTALCPLDLRPGVAQRHRAVEHQPLGGRVRDRRRSSPAARTGSGSPGVAPARLGSTQQPVSTSSEFGFRLRLEVLALGGTSSGSGLVNRWS